MPPPRARRLTRPLRKMWEALPPFPRLPGPRRIAAWWRNDRHDFLPAQRLPSAAEIAASWRQRKHQTILPPPPRVLSPRAIASQLRQRKAAALEPPLPPVPTPGSILSSFQDQSPRRRRRIKFLAATIAVVLPLVFFGGPPASRTIKAWQARRQAHEATTLIARQNWIEASRKIQSAYQLSQTEPAVSQAYARLLSRTGQADLAVEWWQKIGQGQALSPEDRRDYAGAALSASELTIASEQVASLLAQPAPTPQDFLLAGQLSTLRGYKGTAGKYAERVLNDRRSTSREQLGANLIILSIDDPESASCKEASQRLLEIARFESDPAAPQALAVLAQQRSPTRLTQTTNNSPNVQLPAITINALSLEEIADRLDRNPNSRPFHRTLALELRARAQPTREEHFVRVGIQSYGDGDDETLIALASWLYSRRRFEAMLEILPLERSLRRRELLMERIDALAALNQLPEVKELLLGEHPVLEPAFAHMYLAIVRSKLGEVTAGSNEWYRALELAHSPRALIGLADYAEKMGALEIADAAYSRLIQKQPGLKFAYLSRFQLAQVRGRTAEARDFATQIVRRWPEDDPTRVREIYLRLLLTLDEQEAKRAEEETVPLLLRNPWDGGARSALALARLKQGKNEAALTTLTEFMPGVPSSAVSASVYAAALKANGWSDQALEQAQKLATQKILPEERALIASILNSQNPSP